MIVPLVALAIAAVAGPVPTASPDPSPGAVPRARTLSVVCEATPFYVFIPGTDRPLRAGTPRARLGQRFALVSGPRTTLEGFQFYETDVTVVDPGYPRSHYWLGRDCAIPIR